MVKEWEREKKRERDAHKKDEFKQTHFLHRSEGGEGGGQTNKQKKQLVPLSLFPLPLIAAVSSTWHFYPYGLRPP